MRMIRKGTCLILASVMMLALSACSTKQVTDVFDDLVEDTAGITETVTPMPKTAITDPKTIDPSIEAPNFEKNLKGSITIAKGGNYPLEVSAVSTDGGTITYQWYRNNINSNGGGSPITGATSPVFTATAADVGSVFYYVVASNNHDNTCNMATSGTFEVNTIKDGKWQTDEFGKKYVNEDGTYPVEIWAIIEDDTYHFDSAGYVSVGWLGVGNSFYYFTEEGKLLRNGDTPDGYKTDANGKLVGSAVPELSPTTAEIAQAAHDAAQAAAEEAERAAAEAAANQAYAEEQYEEQPQEEYVEEYVEENNDDGADDGGYVEEGFTEEGNEGEGNGE